MSQPHTISNGNLTFSLSRLLIQLWPGFVFLYFLAVRTPEEALAPLETVERAGRIER